MSCLLNNHKPIVETKSILAETLSHAEKISASDKDLALLKYYQGVAIVIESLKMPRSQCESYAMNKEFYSHLELAKRYFVEANRLNSDLSEEQICLILDTLLAGVVYGTDVSKLSFQDNGLIDLLPWIISGIGANLREKSASSVTHVSTDSKGRVTSTSTHTTIKIRINELNSIVLKKNEIEAQKTK